MVPKACKEDRPYTKLWCAYCAVENEPSDLVLDGQERHFCLDISAWFNPHGRMDISTT